eukprot:gene57041-biopygen88021
MHSIPHGSWGEVRIRCAVHAHAWEWAFRLDGYECTKRGAELRAHAPFGAGISSHSSTALFPFADGPTAALLLCCGARWNVLCDDGYAGRCFIPAERWGLRRRQRRHWPPPVRVPVRP